MKIFLLHIETTTKICSVAVSCNGNLMALKETDESEYVHGEMITLFIKEVLTKAKISPKDLHAVSVSSGPGSYTGLRIGVSTAKGLCYGLNIPLISVDTLYGLAVLAREKEINGTICAMIDARRMEVFSIIYDENFNIIKKLSADVLDENTYSPFEPYVAIGNGADKMVDLWKNRNVRFNLGIKLSATGQIGEAFEKYQKNNFEDIAYFEPFYLKDFVNTSKKGV